LGAMNDDKGTLVPMPTGHPQSPVRRDAPLETVQLPSNGREPSAEIPWPLTLTLMAAALGALVPGILMTLVSAPGHRGSPVYGMLLPWILLPFLLAVAAGWRARHSPAVVGLAGWVVGVALGGIIVYSYGLLVHPQGYRNIVLFLWVPLWQCLLLTRPTLRAFRAGGTVPSSAGIPDGAPSGASGQGLPPVPTERLDGDGAAR
jgi:hypothetical protein